MRLLGWNLMLIFARVFFPIMTVLMLFQTPYSFDNWSEGWWLLPLQVFAIASSLRTSYVSWFRDRLR